MLNRVRIIGDQVIARFSDIEKTSGFVLIVCAVAALGLANLPATAEGYHHALAYQVSLGLPGLATVTLPLEEWIKEGLMTIFFFVVGLELKRELLEGELSEPRAALLPIAAAVGGMVVPGMLYWLLNLPAGFPAVSGAPGSIQGWPVPMATDIAFALAALSIIARGLPSSLRIFLLTLAVVDDLGAVVLIAIMFSRSIAWLPMAGAVASLGVMLFAGWRKAPAWIHVPLALVVWAFALQSGVNTSVAGVAAAFAIPVADGEKLQKVLHPISSLIVLPIFALAATGIPLAGVSLRDVLSPVPVGIAAGLVLGKPLGVLLASFGVIRAGWAVLPENTTRGHLFGVSCLCGIGFTMSLFLAALAFRGAHELEIEARLGIIMGSIGALILAWAVFAASKKSSPAA